MHSQHVVRKNYVSEEIGVLCEVPRGSWEGMGMMEQLTGCGEVTGMRVGDGSFIRQ